MRTAGRSPVGARGAHRATVHVPSGARGASAWSWLVGVSALALLGVVVLLAAWWGVTSESRVTSYRVVGDLSGIELDLAAADVEIDGGGTDAVEVRRTDDFAFGHDAVEQRAIIAGVLRLATRCPETVLGDCRTAYRIVVPDNVLVRVTTTTGAVRVEGLRGSARVTTDSGTVAIEEFCGTSLRAVSVAGDVHASAECSPERVELRSGSGDVSAIVPQGRYETDAQSEAGSRRVRGIFEAEGAPFSIQALSRTGDVTVEAST